MRVQALLKDLVFPPTCSGCGARGVWLCDVCQAEIPAFADIPGCCRRCGLPIVRGECNCRWLHPRIVAAVSVLPYTGWVANAVRGAKYEGERDRALYLGTVLASSTAAGTIRRADLVVPVPMHRKREWERGYNQAALIALRACEELGVAAPVGAVVQHDERRSQVGLSAYQRRTNVRGSFSLEDTVHLRQGAHIVVVDDVRTTGSTLSSCAEVLGGLRPARIDVVTLAAEVSDEVAAHIGLLR